MKKFQDYLEKRLDKAEISQIEAQAKSEFEFLKALQDDVSKAVAQYMAQESIGFNELVRRLGVSPSQLTKIQKGEANVTLASLAHFAALLGKKPKISFEDNLS
jgi:transcriptional regulator with XRE-family HTH domain